jgi:hypothetical protein
MPNSNGWNECPESSNLARFKYDDKTRDLTVEFKGGRTYIYSKVPKNLYKGLKQADSKGSFLNEHIKPTYPARKA